MRYAVAVSPYAGAHEQQARSLHRHTGQPAPRPAPARGRKKADMPRETTGPRTEPIPERIARALRTEIDRGAYPAGAYLPSEKTLSATFGAASNMVRQGLSILSAEGWVTTVNGKGSLVLPRPTPAAVIALNPADPWQDIEATGTEKQLRQAADSRTADLLNIELHEPLACISQAATHNPTGATVRMARIVPEASLIGLEPRPLSFDPRETIITALAKAHGPLRYTVRTGAQIPDTDDRELLALHLGTVIAQALWITQAHDGHPLILDTLRVSGATAELETAAT
jgi:DNA-binding GntR family transcriptional regulator